MEKFLEIFLPEGILEWFEIKKIEKDEKAEKKTYKTPELTRLGNVKQLTTGGPPNIKPDEAGISI